MNYLSQKYLGLLTEFTARPRKEAGIVCRIVRATRRGARVSGVRAPAPLSSEELQAEMRALRVRVAIERMQRALREM